MSIYATVARRATATPDAIALRCSEGAAVTFANVKERVDAAVTLLAQLNVSRGDRIALLGRNDPSQLILLAACSAAGVAVSLLNWRLTSRELLVLLQAAAPAALFAGASMAAKAGALVEANEQGLTLVQSPSENLLDPGAGRQLRVPPASLRKSEPGDLVLCFTSGSSGRPKAVRLTETNLEAASQQALQQADWGWSETAVSLCALPLFHIAGLRAALFPLLHGGTAVFSADNQPETLLRALAKHKVTKLSIVPTLLGSMLRAPAFAEYDLSELKTVFYGGAPMPEVLLVEVRAKLSCDLVQIYGLTETTGAALALGPGDHFAGCQKLRSCGRPLAGVSLRIANGATGASDDAEVALKGATICAGYWNCDEENAASFRDGWFHTGDSGQLDEEGYLYLRGRLGDLIKSGGEKVVPTEVEEILLRHPCVRDAGVVGLPDPTWGERVAAAVVLERGVTIGEDELLGHCRELLAGYKLPKQLVMVDALPRNANGKLVRKQLRELLAGSKAHE